MNRHQQKPELFESIRAPGAVPYVLIARAILVLALVGVAVTFRDFGITWDEYDQHVYGQKLLDYYASGLRDTSAFTYVNLYFYGGLFDMLAAVLVKVLPFGIYETRHLLGGLIGLAGLWGAFKLTEEIAGPRAALLALIMLLATPLLVGHSFVNPKDAPLAWMSMWAMWLGCRMIRTSPAIARGTMIGFGFAFGAVMGQRIIGGHIGAWLAIIALAWPALDRAAGPSARRMIVAGLLAAPIAIVVMIAFWPWSAQAPGNVLAALTEFSAFHWTGTMLWNGQVVASSDIPAGYVPRLLLAQLPDVALFGLFAGLAGLVMWRPRMNATTIATVFVILTVAAPVAIAMAVRPTLYNGLRHFLFVVPPLTVLAAVGLERCLTKLIAADRRRSAIGLMAIVGVGVAMGFADSIRLHPYQYVSFNRLTGGIPGAEPLFELDSWGASLAELSRDVAATVAVDPRLSRQQSVAVFVCGRVDSASRVLSSPFRVVEDLAQADVYLGLEVYPCTNRYKISGDLIGQVRRDGVALSSAYRLQRSE